MVKVVLETLHFRTGSFLESIERFFLAPQESSAQESSGSDQGYAPGASLEPSIEAHSLGGMQKRSPHGRDRKVSVGEVADEAVVEVGTLPTDSSGERNSSGLSISSQPLVSPPSGNDYSVKGHPRSFGGKLGGDYRCLVEGILKDQFYGGSAQFHPPIDYARVWSLGEKQHSRLLPIAVPYLSENASEFSSPQNPEQRIGALTEQDAYSVVERLLQVKRFGDLTSVGYQQLERFQYWRLFTSNKVLRRAWEKDSPLTYRAPHETNQAMV